MPWPLPRRLGVLRAAGLGLLLLLAALQSWATSGPVQAAPAAPALVLREAQGTLPMEGLVQVWLDPGGQATIEQVADPAGPAQFQPGSADVIYSLGSQGALWIRMNVLRGQQERQQWLIEFPMPVLDLVTVFQRQGDRWTAESAGDNLAVDRWPEGGRYPYFRLDLPADRPAEVFARIRHTTSANFPVQLTTAAAHDQRVQLEYLGLGLTFGALLVLIIACLSQSWVYRDAVYAWYSAYAMVTALAVAAYTGVASHLLWPGWGALGDAHQASLAYFTCGSALLFVRNIIGIPARHPVADKLVLLLGLAGLAFGLAHPMLPKLPALALLSAYMIVATLVNVTISLSAWRRGDLVGFWIFVAFSPVLVSMAMAAVRMFGWLPVSFGTQYAVVIALALEVPLLLVALAIRSRERHGAQIREQALSTQDALTGLLAPHLFHDRLRQVVARYKRDRESAAVVFIDLVNHSRIKDYYGSAVAEQSLLRSVIKLRRLLRDVDTVSRIGECRFGVIMEGVDSRIAITDRAARLIAAGLMPLNGLKPDVTLQFHIAGVLLDERVMEPAELCDALAGLLGSMSPRTRRPIRFIQPENTQPVPLGSDSSLLSDDDISRPVRGAAAAEAQALAATRR